MKINQILYFDTQFGIFKKTVFNIVGIKEGDMVHLKLSDGRKILINKQKLIMAEIIPDRMGKDTWGELSGTYSANNEEWNADEIQKHK